MQRKGSWGRGLMWSTYIFFVLSIFFGFTSHKEITLAAVGRMVCRVQKQKQGNHYAAYHGGAVRGHRLWEWQQTWQKVHRYKTDYRGELGVRGTVMHITAGFLSPPTTAPCFYLQIHIYCTNGHLGALSGDGLLVLSQHLLSAQS